MKITEIKRSQLLINGVYMIRNIVNNHFYIGNSSSKYYIYNRLINHRKDLLKGTHYNKYLQNDFDEYGKNSFEISILEKCEPNQCVVREQYWIELLTPVYNVVVKAGSSGSLGREVSQETRNKISEANKLYWSNPDNKSKMKKAFQNRTYSGKPRKRPVYTKPKVYTEEGLASLKKANSVKVKNMITGEVYSSVKQASEILGVNYTTLSGVINGKRKHPKLKNIIKYE